ncbi:unnamed protein product [marine sediment metagenome]|uniref:Uncharacterized protein n=1 Tax=marine sediment metagenome TaxID=412755 RepID=X1L7T5_9ZZZZ
MIVDNLFNDFLGTKESKSKSDEIEGDLSVDSDEAVNDLDEKIDSKISDFAGRLNYSLNKTFKQCSNCGTLNFFSTGVGICSSCGADYSGGEWVLKKVASDRKKKKSKSQEFENVELDDGDFFVGKSNTILKVAKIGKRNCPICNFPVDWDNLNPLYREGFMFVAKDCPNPECGDEAFRLDKDKKVWLPITGEDEEEAGEDEDW